VVAGTSGQMFSILSAKNLLSFRLNISTTNAWKIFLIQYLDSPLREECFSKLVEFYQKR